jgi:hypothetical protein
MIAMAMPIEKNGKKLGFLEIQADAGRADA